MFFIVIDHSSVLAFTFFFNPPSDAKWKQKVYLQQNIVMTTCGNPQAEDELHIAIAHWIAAHCLPFSMSEDTLFKRMLAKARATNHMYVPPPGTKLQAVCWMPTLLRTRKMPLTCFLQM